MADVGSKPDLLSTIDLAAIADPTLRALVTLLVNEIEAQRRTIEVLREQNVYLRKRLGVGPGGGGGGGGAGGAKGGGPGAVRNNAPKDKSSTKDRQNARAALDAEKGIKPNQGQRGRPAGVRQIVIDEERDVATPPPGLPADVEFKGYGEGRTVQDLVLKKHAIRFYVGSWYSPSEHKTYHAELPAGVRGSCGPQLLAYVLTCHNVLGATHSRLHEHLLDLGFVISAGALSNLLVTGHEALHDEKDAMHREAVSASAFVQMDDTSTKVNGKGAHCFTVGNPAFTSLVTQPSKDRVNAIGALGGGSPEFVVNEEAIARAERIGVPASYLELMREMPFDVRMDGAALDAMVLEHIGKPGAGSLRLMREAMALTALGLKITIPRGLMADGATTFDDITELRGGCGIHGGRHFSELMPGVPQFQLELADAKHRYWKIFERIERYRESPTPREAQSIRAAFDRLVAHAYEYSPLRDVLGRMREHREQLLWSLRYPFLPAENNLSERDLRGRAKKRDVSYGPRTWRGLRSWDTFQSIYGTLRKLGVGWWAFLCDRIEGRGTIQSLASLAVEKLRALGIDSSVWELDAPVAHAA